MDVNMPRRPDSPWTYLLARAEMVHRRCPSLGPMTLTVAELDAAFAEQHGVCAISGLALTLPRTGNALARQRHSPWKISLDRIDNARGYVTGNVRVVCQMANYCRNDFTDDDVRAFARAVVNFDSLRGAVNGKAQFHQTVGD